MVEHCSGTLVLHPSDEAQSRQPHEILKVEVMEAPSEILSSIGRSQRSQVDSGIEGRTS